MVAKVFPKRFTVRFRLNRKVIRFRDKRSLFRLNFYFKAVNGSILSCAIAHKHHFSGFVQVNIYKACVPNLLSLVR